MSKHSHTPKEPSFFSPDSIGMWGMIGLMLMLGSDLFPMPFHAVGFIAGAIISLWAIYKI